VTIPGHATNDEPCDICEHPIGASRETHHRHVICAPCSSYVTSARKHGGARAGAALAAAAAAAAPRATAAPAAPAQPQPAVIAPAAAPAAELEASFSERIAAEIERQQGKGEAAVVSTPAIASTKEPGGKTLLEQIADGIEAQTKRDPNAPTSVHNINLGISYTP
jgi:hypothetical protein